MTQTEHDLAARSGGELIRDRGSRRRSSAIDAQRRLNARRADGTRTKAEPFGPSDPRYAQLTRAHDEEGRLVKAGDRSVEGRENEGEVEFYGKIIGRAKVARERAAESLRPSRASRKRRGDLAAQADAAQRQRRFGRRD
jgi:hypothetical protein